MLEEQVANLLQRYLGNYVQGLNKEALKFSVWRGDVELTNMQLKPEALNALKLPVKVKAGFLGSVKLKVPWSRLGQEPVLIYLDQILILAEPATDVEGCSEDAIQETKRMRVQELEVKLLENQQKVKTEMNSSWLGSLINTIIGNLKLLISNVHIRYEDHESNPGHPFAAGVILKKLSAVTVDDIGNETFATGGALDHIQKSLKLESLGMYFDSDILPWRTVKPWTDLLPAEWIQIFEVDKSDAELSIPKEKHKYIIQPVSGSARYDKLQVDESENTGQPIQKAVVNLEDVTLCLPKDAYRDVLKLADNFNSFNQRLRYAHYRPNVPVKADPRSWWKYAYRVVVDEMKKASGKFSWEQVLKYARLRKKYVTLYASLLKADVNRLAIDNNKDLANLDRELDIEVILQWRMLAHTFLEQSAESGSAVNRQPSRKSWWSFGWGGPSKDESEPGGFSDDDWDRLNRIIGYKEDGAQLTTRKVRGDMLLSLFEIHMEHNASKLIISDQKCLADLSCDGIYFSVKIYPETKTIDLKLNSYKLMSPNGPLAESATISDSFVGVFSYKPFDALIDWSLTAKASPCYMTYLKDSIDDIISFFKSGTDISQTLALETANAVQMTIDGVKRTAQQQVSQALKDHARFSLDLDIAAPKITIPTKFCPDGINETRLLLDLGNLMLSTQEYWELDYDDNKDQYLQFNIVLSDVSAFLVDGDYSWNKITHSPYRPLKSNFNYYLPVIDKCMVALKVQQIESESPVLPSMRISLRFPSLAFYFSPARYHRLMQVAKIFENENDVEGQTIFPWTDADYEGWVSVLAWKGMGNREAIWQHRYLYLVGPSLYILENPTSERYKQYFSLRGKQVFLVPEGFAGKDNVLAVSDAAHSSLKVVEDLNALILRLDNDDSRKTWQNRFQGAIYRTSGPAALSSLSEISSNGDRRTTSRMTTYSISNAETLFLTGVLDELKIGFSCNYQDNKRHDAILLYKESSLFEFRANGGQVELSMKDSNLYIGTLLKSLEIEDQFLQNDHNQIRFLARSFIHSSEDIPEMEAASVSRNQKLKNTRVPSFDTEEQFFEACESLGEPSDSSPQYLESFPVHGGSYGHDLSIKPPSFSRIPGLLPDGKCQVQSKDVESNTPLDSFVKGQIVFYQQDSPLYSNIDKQVSVTLGTLSFFCHRPTILAILEFVNAINSEEDHSDMDGVKHKDFVDTSTSENVEEAVKGLLGKGKSRVLFQVVLNMARTQIYLVDETGCYLATLSQNNLQANVKVFPSSFSIKAALGNLKISDDSLPHNHSYFWICDMRNPGGSSFVELDFTSFSAEDDDYFGYDYSLTGQLSEVRIVYLNRFVQEVVSYFMGLLPSSSSGTVKFTDQISDSEKLFTTDEVQGSSALKLDLSFSRPIIIMPRQTDSLDYLELDVLHITVKNSFHWIGANKDDLSAVHLEVMTIQVKEINLTVGTGNVVGENIIEDVRGLSIILRRSLRDLWHKIPVMETLVEVGELKAALSSKEYQVITECAVSNISETPRTIPPLRLDFHSPENDDPGSTSVSAEGGSQPREEYVSMKVSVIINLAQLQLYMGLSRDTPLATVQAVGTWFLYKSSSSNESSIWATLKSFTVTDDREGTKDEFRHAIGQHHTGGGSPFSSGQHWIVSSEKRSQAEHNFGVVSTMLMLDVKFKRTATSILLCIQRPHLLVALDFLLATTEFFVPTVRSFLSDEDGDDRLNVQGAIVLDKAIYMQPHTLFCLSPKRPLIVDDDRFDHYVYDGQGGTLHLESNNFESIIFVGNGKRLQFRNVLIKNGKYLDSYIFLGSNSSYSASEDDEVFFGTDTECPDSEHEQMNTKKSSMDVAEESGGMEYLIELQAIGPELTFYNTSRDLGDSSLLSSKLLHAELDIICSLAMKGDNTEITGNILGFRVESNGIRVLEPFDISVKLSIVSGVTNISLSVSDVFMNFSYSMLKLFLAVQEDILTFLRMTTKKVSVTCSQFDKVGTLKNGIGGQTYAFWRARAPPGFAVLGDCLTPLNEPPSRGVLAVNTSFIRVKRPVSFKLIWPPVQTAVASDQQDDNVKEGASRNAPATSGSGIEQICSIWFPVAPQGYVAVGCIVSKGEKEPPLSSSLCISASLISPCSLRDCIALRLTGLYSMNLAFWRVDNSFGTFLPTDITSMALCGKAYELRQKSLERNGYVKGSRVSNRHVDASVAGSSHQLQQPVLASSCRLFEAVANFKLVWWNHGSQCQQKLSIWRPVVPHGMFFSGDIAVSGFEPPNACYVFRNSGSETLLKAPFDFQLVGRIRKQKTHESISFWLPQAPPGYVCLGCIASRNSPKLDDFGTLRCIRSDMVTSSQFPEESIWHTSDAKISNESFSIWSTGNEVGTFVVRRGQRKPPRRFALKLADLKSSSGSDTTVIDTEIKSLSLALYDDYGGLMVPLFNISASGVRFSLHGRADYMNIAASFTVAGRSYNDKYDAWEPLIEPTDGYLRYQYDSTPPSTNSQLRIVSTKDLNINVSVSNMNLLLQAYSSWNSLSLSDESSKSIELVAPSDNGKSAINAHHKRDYFIIPQNKLGRDIFIRATALQKYSNVMKMPSGDNKPIKVPVSKDMLDSHLHGDLVRRKLSRCMVTMILFGAELPALGGLCSGQLTAVVRIYSNQDTQPIQQQSARTCGAVASRSLESGTCIVDWREMFFFKVDYPECYIMELMVMDIGTGQPVGLLSAPLVDIASKFNPGLPINADGEWMWRELSSPKWTVSQENKQVQTSGKIKFSVFLPAYFDYGDKKQSLKSSTKSGFVQISPGREGPWTTVRLNYAAAAACWRLGNDVVASELSLRNGSRYVTIRSLVCVTNNTDFLVDLGLKSQDNSVSTIDNTDERMQEEIDSGIYETDIIFEVQKHFPSVGWASVSTDAPSTNGSSLASHDGLQGVPKLDLQSGWEWVDDWHVDNTYVTDVNGWVYAPDVEDLRWPDSSIDKNTVRNARQRRWIRHRRYSLSKQNNQMPLGLLNPGDKLPLPLQALVHPVSSYFLQLRPVMINNSCEYSWSTVKLQKRKGGVSITEDKSDLCVSDLVESEILIYCSEMNKSSCRTHGLWFSVSIQATEIGKDIHLDPIHDWRIIIQSPLSITNYLPLPAAYTIFDKTSNRQDNIQVKGSFMPGESIKVYGVDFLNPLFISLNLQGWDPMQEPVCLTDPRKLSSKTASIKNSASGRVIQILFEQNEENDVYSIARLVRVYAPYWLSSARCPPMVYKIFDMSATKERTWSSVSTDPDKASLRVVWEVSDREMHEGYTVASAISFKHFGLSLSLDGSEQENFGHVKSLSTLGDLDGSFDMYAYDAAGNCFRTFISSKPCSYPAVPSKVITIRPYMTFTNRTGQDILLKFGTDPLSKVLHAFDIRVPFICHEHEASNNLRFQLRDTDWSCPIEVSKEDNFTVMLRKNSGFRSFLKVEIRGYEEGSRFLVVFRPGSSTGPFRIENRIFGKTICIRQSGSDDENWIQLQPFSTTNFAWEDPYGLRLADICILNDIRHVVQSVNIESGVDCPSTLREEGICLYTYEVGDIKIARFTDIPRLVEPSLNERLEPFALTYGVSTSKLDETSSNPVPMELVIEIGTLGVSLIDHKPRELLFIYLERVFIAYSIGYDGGSTSRFKLVVGQLQLDNQLPLTVMPVLLAPESIADTSHPVFKTTIMMRNENTEGTQVYPYIYVRVTDKCWRLNIHEPIIWELVNLYHNLHLDRLSSHSDVMVVDPEIRINLIDVSEIKLKISVETTPTQRPPGVLGIWSPVLSAIGNALKIQVHLRKVMHENRFMRKSAVVPSILNRVRRDLIHDPLHLIFSVDVLGMTKSTFASLSKGFAELSTDGQFLQLRSKQVWSRRITGIGDGILQGTEALAQGVAFGVSGVVKKPIESARQYGVLGLAQGLGRAFLGFIVQPVSGALDFVSLTVDGISASFTRCLDILSNKTNAQRIRNPRAIHANGVLTEYCEKEALGQMILYLAEASRHLGCTDLFKEPSKYAWSDIYEGHFHIPYHRILLVTNRRFMLLQCLNPDKMDKRPCKIIWDVPWEELLALELAKAGYPKPSHLIVHLKNFKKAESFVRIIKCNADQGESDESQAVRISSFVRQVWKARLTDMKLLTLKVPSSQRHVQFAWDEPEERDSRRQIKPIFKPMEIISACSDDKRFIRHVVNFQKIWSSELESRRHCTLCPKQVRDESAICSIWRPSCPDGYISVGDIARIGMHPPNVAAVYHYSDGIFASPLGYDLVWRNCVEDYTSPLSVWHPRAPEGFAAMGCVAVAKYEEPDLDLVYCVTATIAEEAGFENRAVWTAPDSYPWSCYFYQVQSEALQFVALRQEKERSDHKAMRISEHRSQELCITHAPAEKTDQQNVV